MEPSADSVTIDLSMLLDLSERLQIAQAGKNPADYTRLTLDACAPPQIGRDAEGWVLQVAVRIPDGLFPDLDRPQLFGARGQPVPRKLDLFGLPPTAGLVVRVAAISEAGKAAMEEQARQMIAAMGVAPAEEAQPGS